MKLNIRLYIKLLLVFPLILTVTSCNEQDFLEEDPKDFLSPENAFESVAMFEAAVGFLHRYARDMYLGDTNFKNALFALGTDISYHGVRPTTGEFCDYGQVNPAVDWAEFWWDINYSIIAQANTIIEKAEEKSDLWSEEADKNAIIAEARFFRAWADKILADLYGGVPIVAEAITSPQANFERASREAVYQFAAEDLEFASQWLPETVDLEGRIVKAAADHVLSEVYISLERWDDAIASASAVIDDPKYELMTERFGSKIDWEGDVYWDLFRVNNQNRSSGNTESIWVLQFDWETPGGGVQTGGWRGVRGYGPRYWQLPDPDGNPGMLLVDSLGRGVGWNRMTPYVEDFIWETDPNDMRNSKYNFKREFIYNNPNSAYFGQKVDPDNLYNPADTSFRYFPFLVKTLDWPHPGGIYNTGMTWRDLYAIRLAETYLLRAEAHLGKGDLENAAEDINVIRSRANATPVDPSNVNIDYILDERTRELVTEEMRRATLSRLGKLVERVRRFNPPVGPSIQEHHNLLPIPQREIDLNLEGNLEQNAGY